MQVTALCVLAAVFALLLKRGSGELGMTLTLAATVAVFLFLAGPMGEVLDFLRELSDKAGVGAELLTPLYKTIGVALVVRIGGSLCRDAGESALAAVIETAGSICALLVALPLLRTVLRILLELMNG